MLQLRFEPRNRVNYFKCSEPIFFHCVLCSKVAYKEENSENYATSSEKKTNQTNTMYWVHFERVSINQNQLKNRSH